MGDSQEGLAVPPTDPPASAVSGLAVTYPGGAPSPLPVDAGDVPRMVQRYVADAPAGEPTLAINARGAVLFPSISFDEVPGQATVTLYVSRDNGTTWQDVTPPLAGAVPVPAATLDPYVHADPATGRQFSVDLYLGCSYLRWTDDDGATWEENPIACGTPVNDHQTLFSGPPVGQTRTEGYPTVLYYCSNRVHEAVCDVSLDGGRSFRPGSAAFSTLDAALGEGRECGLDEALHGHGHASAATGRAYLPKTGSCGALLAVSPDNGQGWEVVLVDDTVGTTGHDASVATDAAGNVYYLFLDGDSLPRLSVSTDGGTTWGAPMAVGHPNVTAALHPQVVAGDEGRVAFLYVGTTHPAGALDYAGPPQLGPAPHPDQTWEAYVGYSYDALAPRPTILTRTAHDPSDPLKRGHCHAGCGGSEGDGAGMRDFLDIDIHPTTGQVWVALVDLCTDATHPDYPAPPCNSPGGTPDSYQAPRGAVGVQVGGLRLIGGP